MLVYQQNPNMLQAEAPAACNADSLIEAQIKEDTVAGILPFVET
jgi:hypothetical protein